ncbi:hypothetical protein SISSUDRAFT_1124675 [Sistotremastrum suecicum HHB10207 ss-3]|uniref:CAP-Gly domain-containing protein n=1 Tax=Sistotremastrum suecicum HHB10207 ss-3 TaxID=1314776 RepID=A0A166I9H5_9AGAM|nr:hypothetical protein SISSUDRAFT_1124675 [Sistotremastrum suecicum HHB10207 ss-3]
MSSKKVRFTANTTGPLQERSLNKSDRVGTKFGSTAVNVGKIRRPMSATTPSRPRQSGLPTPGKPSSSGIPTPGRYRASSSASKPDQPTSNVDSDSDISRALSEAIQKNDPANHRISDVSFMSAVSSTTTSSNSLSPQVSKFPATGRRSVAASSRPISAASSSSGISSAPRTPSGTRVKTPVTVTKPPRPSTRPASRQSDFRSSSRLGQIWSPEVGATARVESLGMEGVVRYLGEIDGKPGVWAGVELSGGFTGMGKNDGSVNGVQYFTCPPKCGVFVATPKLSAPTVRPPSVASSRGGRITPAFGSSTGRVTPSFGSSTGRITPAYNTPSAKPRVPKPQILGRTPPPPSFTAGSRASKYAGMTADRLRHATAPVQGSPTRTGSSSPTRASPSRSSPTRTPKAFNVSSRPSSNFPTPTRLSLTPRALPQSHTMPSLSDRTKSITPTSSQFSNTDTAVEDSPEDVKNLEANGKAIQDRIVKLMSSRSSSPRRREEDDLLAMPPPPPPRFLPIEDDKSDKLRSELEVSEKDNSRLREEVETLKASLESANTRALEQESRVAQLIAVEDNLRDTLKSLAEKDTLLADLQVKVTSAETLVTELQTSTAQTERTLTERLEAKEHQFQNLQSRLTNLTRDWDDERKFLNLQIDELRSAGQETIALYEERVNAAESRRYEMEDHLAALESKLQDSTRPVSPTSMARQASTAVQIENESLTEQVLHMQKKISELEEKLDDARAAAEKEESSMRNRVTRYRDADVALRTEMEALKIEIEKGKKTEKLAQARVEEVEAALCENDIALENARAEIESLRFELVDLENQVNHDPKPEKNDNISEDSKRHAEEVAQLEARLEQSEASVKHIMEQFNGAKAQSDHFSRLHEECLVQLRNLEEERAEWERLQHDTEAELESQRQQFDTVQTALDERSVELDAFRKSSQDRPLTPAPVPEKEGRPSKHELNEKREEIAGLKHIVQQLSQTNASLNSQMKLVEDERNILISETEKLREDLRRLEIKFEQSVTGSNHGLGISDVPGLSTSEIPGASVPQDSESLHALLKNLAQKHELETNDLHKKISELEQKHAREVLDFNKEISELESLIETKIYREDDLERELERCKEKLARVNKKSSKSSGEGLRIPSPHSPNTSGLRQEGQQSGDHCEICDQPGHDIFTCPMLKDGQSSHESGYEKKYSNDSRRTSDVSALWCEDCESAGHVAADCPHSLDVF